MYRDYEQAAEAVTYHEGEPVTVEQPVVDEWNYPAGWDKPTGEWFNMTYLDLTKRRGSGGNFPDRQDIIEELVRKAHEPITEYSPQVWCPDCGGDLLESYDWVVCDTCEYTNNLVYNDELESEEVAVRLIGSGLTGDPRPVCVLAGCPKPATHVMGTEGDDKDFCNEHAEDFHAKYNTPQSVRS